MGYTGGSYYPPEYRHLRWASSAISDADSTGVSSKTDIFQLGLLLWLLAENTYRTNNSPFCIREKCNLKAQGCQNASSCSTLSVCRNFRTLSRSTSETWLINVVPKTHSNRPAAWTLLECFPRVKSHDKIDLGEIKPESLNLDRHTTAQSMVAFHVILAVNGILGSRRFLPLCCL